MIREFNLRFYNEKHYGDGHRHPLLLEYEENRDNEPPFFKEVLDFCLHTDVVKTTGLTLQDMLNMDLNLFIRLKNEVIKESERKAAILDKEQKSQQQRQQALLGGLKK